MELHSDRYTLYIPVLSGYSSFIRQLPCIVTTWTGVRSLIGNGKQCGCIYSKYYVQQKYSTFSTEIQNTISLRLTHVAMLEMKK